MRRFPLLRVGILLFALVWLAADVRRRGAGPSSAAAPLPACEPEYVYPADMSADGGVSPGKEREVLSATPGRNQRKAPCDSAQEQYAINGYCWIRTAKAPPCAPLYHHQGHCYAAVGTRPRPDTSIHE